MTRRGRMAVRRSAWSRLAIAVVVGLVGGLAAATTPSRSARWRPSRTTTCPWTRSRTIPDRIRTWSPTPASPPPVSTSSGARSPARGRRIPANPADPAYDFSRADLILQGLAERGITPIVSVYTRPDLGERRRDRAAGAAARRRFNTAGPRPRRLRRLHGGPRDPLLRGASRRRAARRCRASPTSRSGTSRTCPGFLLQPGWDDPSLSVQDLTDGRLDTYAAMVEAAYAAMKEANPEATVIAGVGGPRGSTSRTGVGRRSTGCAGLVEPADPARRLLAARLPVRAAARGDDRCVPSWSTIGRFLERARRVPPRAGPLHHRGGLHDGARPRSATRRSPRRSRPTTSTQIYSLPQLRSERVKTVVWFNLQDNAELARGPAPRGRLAQAELRAVRERRRGPGGDDRSGEPARARPTRPRRRC